MTELSSAIYSKGPDSLKDIKVSGYARLFTICLVSSLFGGVVSTLMSVYLPVALRDLLGVWWHYLGIDT